MSGHVDVLTFIRQEVHMAHCEASEQENSYMLYEKITKDPIFPITAFRGGRVRSIIKNKKGSCYGKV